MDTTPFHSMHSNFQELKHMKREPLSPIYVDFYASPSARTPDTFPYYHEYTAALHPSNLMNTWKNGLEMESDQAIRSHCDFYLSEDEMTYLNELFKSDPVELDADNNKIKNGNEQKMEVKNESNKTKARSRKRAMRFTKSSTLEIEEIQKYFDMPITAAAKKMNVGLTVLKKRCRELNIMRWPHRKIKSLKSLISNVKELGLEKEIEMLEEHRITVEKMPHIELTEKTKKLRQACFKANYKKRRQMQASGRLSQLVV